MPRLRPARRPSPGPAARARLRCGPALCAALAASLAAIAAPPAAANDSIAGLVNGGLVLRRSDAVELREETLRISPERISVDYVFRNRSGADIAAEVAFPMPDLTGGPDANIALPDPGADDFLGFRVTQDGRPITPALEQRALLGGQDITATLAAAGIPPVPLGERTARALAALPPATVAEFARRGFVEPVEYDAGQGWQTELVPLWTLRSAFHWPTVFPAGRDVAVHHAYRPSVGASVGLSMADPESGRVVPPAPDPWCMDADFVRTVERRLAGPQGPMALYETRIDYVLGTGGNWAGGRIGRFTLEVDKGRPDALLSFCGTGVVKTGPTTFRMQATDYAPPPMLRLLILTPPPG